MRSRKVAAASGEETSSRRAAVLEAAGRLCDEAHLLQQLSARQLGIWGPFSSTVHPTTFIRKIIRSLVASRERSWACKRPFVSKSHRFLYANGVVVAPKGASERSQMMQSIVIREDLRIGFQGQLRSPKGGKLKDWGLFVNENNQTEDSCILLYEGNYVEARDLHKGRLLERLDLSSYTAIPLGHISTEVETSTIHLKSTLSNAKPAVVTLISLKYPNMSVISRLDVTKEVFGKQVRDADLDRGMLFTFASNGTINIYNARHVFRKLGRPEVVLEPKGSFWVDSNCSKRPLIVDGTMGPGPPLMNIRTYGHFAMFLSTSDLTRIVCNLKTKNFEVVRTCDGVSSDQPVPPADELVGTFQGNPTFRDVSVTFHPDDSSRLVYCGFNKISIYQINRNDDDSGPAKLEKTFMLDAGRPGDLDVSTLSGDGSVETACEVITHLGEPRNHQGPSDPEPTNTISRYGRKIQCRAMSEETSAYISKGRTIAYDYDDELDVLAVLVADTPSGPLSGSDDEDFVDEGDDSFSCDRFLVLFLDGKTNRTLKKISIEADLEPDWSEAMIQLDLDILLLRFLSSGSSITFACILT